MLFNRLLLSEELLPLPEPVNVLGVLLAGRVVPDEVVHVLSNVALSEELAETINETL